MTYPSCPPDVIFDAIEDFFANRCIWDHNDTCDCPSLDEITDLVDTITKGLGDLERRHATEQKAEVSPDV